MTLALILPPRLNGFPIDYMPDPSGAVDVAVWRSEQRDEGLLVHCADWPAVRRLVADLQAMERKS